MISFNRVDFYDNILQGWVYGTTTEAFELLTDEKLINDSMWLLEKFMDQSLPRPKDMRRTKWLTSKNFLGAGSFLSMASENTESTPMDLAKSLSNNIKCPKILFAGEATHDKYTGSSNGAIKSGWRAADEVLKYHKIL